MTAERPTTAEPGRAAAPSAFVTECGCPQSFLFNGQNSVWHTSVCVARDERRRMANRLRSQPWSNALPIADAIEKDEWDV